MSRLSPFEPPPASRLRLAIYLLFCLTLSLFPPARPAAAHHRAELSLTNTDTAVRGRVQFGSSSPCRDCPVRVETGSGTTLLELKTDESGKFSFQPPVPDSFVLRVETAHGHYLRQTVETTSAAETQPEAKKEVPKKEPGPPETSKTVKIIAGVVIIFALSGLAWLGLAPGEED